MQFADGSRWQHRARYFVQVKWAIPNHPEWFLTAYEEAFIGLRNLDNPVLNLLQQNRMSVAVNHNLRERHLPSTGVLASKCSWGSGHRRRAQPRVARGRAPQLGLPGLTTRPFAERCSLSVGLLEPALLAHPVVVVDLGGVA